MIKSLLRCCHPSSEIPVASHSICGSRSSISCHCLRGFPIGTVAGAMVTTRLRCSGSGRAPISAYTKKDTISPHIQLSTSSNYTMYNDEHKNITHTYQLVPTPSREVGAYRGPHDSPYPRTGSPQSPLEVVITALKAPHKEASHSATTLSDHHLAPPVHLWLPWTTILCNLMRTQCRYFLKKEST